MIRIIISFFFCLVFFTTHAQMEGKGPSGDPIPQSSNLLDLSEINKGKSRTARNLNPSEASVSFNNFGQLHGIVKKPQDGIYTWSNGRIIAINKTSENASFRSFDELGTAAKDYVFEHRDAMFLGPDTDFSVLDQKEDNLGMSHVKLQQTYKGIKLHGAESWVHGKRGQMTSFNGRTYPMSKEFDITPHVNISQAIAEVTADIGNFEDLDVKSKSLLNREQVFSELVILTEH